MKANYIGNKSDYNKLAMQVVREEVERQKKYFPFSDLLDIEGYAGKRCKRFTDEPIHYGKKPIKNIDGQQKMFEV